MFYVISGHEYVQNFMISLLLTNSVTTCMHAGYESKVLRGHDTRTRVCINMSSMEEWHMHSRPL